MLNAYPFYRAAQALSQVLPRPFAYWLGLRLADVCYACDRSGRRAVIAHLRRILQAQGIHPAEDALRRLARQNFRYFGKYLVDFFQFAQFSSADVRRLVSFERLDYLERAEAIGKGVLLLTAHLGNWELGGAVISALGRTLSAVYQPQRGSRVNRMFEQHRSRRGVRLIPLGQAARGVLCALRRRECVAMLADRDYTAHHEHLALFGAPARLPSGPARLAAVTGAPLLLVFLLRQPDDTFLMRFYEPLVPDGVSVEALRERIRDILEAEIGAHPEQWFMFDDFWRLEGVLCPTDRASNNGAV